MISTESPAITRQVADLEAQIGKRVFLRGVRHRNSQFRGRIVRRSGCIVVEYRDDTAGFFWHYQIIEELLHHVARGRCNVVLYEGGIQYTDVSPRNLSHFQ